MALRPCGSFSISMKFVERSVNVRIASPPLGQPLARRVVFLCILKQLTLAFLFGFFRVAVFLNVCGNRGFKYIYNVSFLKLGWRFVIFAYKFWNYEAFVVDNVYDVCRDVGVCRHAQCDVA